MSKLRKGLYRIELPSRNTSQISPWASTIERKQEQEHVSQGKHQLNKDAFGLNLPLIKTKRYEAKADKLQLKLSQHSLEINTTLSQQRNEETMTKHRFNPLTTFQKKYKKKDNYREYSERYDKKSQLSRQISKIDLINREESVKSIECPHKGVQSERKGVNYQHSKKRSLYHFINQVKNNPSIAQTYIMYHWKEKRKIKSQLA